MADEVTQGATSGFAEPPESVDAAANAIAALLSKNPNPGADPEESAPVTAQTKQESPAGPSETKVAEAEPESAPEPEASEAEQPEHASADDNPPKAAEGPSEKETKPNGDPQSDTLTQLNALIPQLRAQIALEFPEVKTEADLLKIGQEDPQRYNRFQLLRHQFVTASTEQQRLGTEVRNNWLKGEAQKIAKLLPDYVDPVKGVALWTEMKAYALKHGFSEERISTPSAADVLTLHKAMQYDKSQQAKTAEAAKIAAATAKAKEKAASAPPVQKPGTQREDSKADRANDSYKRLQKTNRVEDAAEVFKHIGAV